MAKEESSPGLFSKVVKFVRNPTTDWSELSEPELDRDTAYSKLQLKEMIERKRRNDFVRRREFDQLRKLRSRETRPSVEPGDRPSFFQSSLTSRPSDDRAGTLKKIDEIEEQMSQQWWKTHQKGDAPPDGPQDPPHSTARQAYLPTEAGALTSSTKGSTEAVLPAGDFQLAGRSSGHSGLDALALASHEVSPDVSRFPGETQPVFVHDPEMEEAAIRFANGDAEGAEANLQALLAHAPDQSSVWMALFDYYRATGAQQKFESAALDYAVRFNQLAPLWYSLPEMTGELLDARASAQGAKAAPHLEWRSPAVLDAAAVATLATRLVDASRPWQLDWAALASIDAAAVAPLTALFARWSDSTVRLQFAGAASLLNFLASMTVTGEPTVDAAWWRLRMEVLRTTGNAETFDLTALEYCVTYEVSPPSWSDVRCTYQAQGEDAEAHNDFYVGALQSEFLPTSTMLDSVAPGGVDMHSQLAPMAELAGQLLGDATQSLTPLEGGGGEQRILLVACDKLIRVDFSAAGSILNWAAALQSAGCQVVFCNVHRLIAVFFNVIGINEHARVLPRKD
jgi:anti-anti-sigma regulatory factor